MLIRHASINDSKQIAKVHIKAWQETYGGIISQQYINSLNYEEKVEKWNSNIAKKDNIVLVAEDEACGIVGFAFCGINNEIEYKYDMDFHALYLLKEYKRRGIGKKLFKAMKKEVLQLGYESLIVWALEDNPNIKFYEAMGGTLVGKQNYLYGDRYVTLVAFGYS